MAYAVPSDMYQYLHQVPVTPENEALFTVLLERASDIVDGELNYLVFDSLLPIPPAVTQVTLELAINMWQQRDRGGWADNKGVEGEGGMQYVGYMSPKQQQLLVQVRINADGLCI